jgi:concanavalin A-like lectin/glucanase superfamily protein
VKKIFIIVLSLSCSFYIYSAENLLGENSFSDMSIWKTSAAKSAYSVIDSVLKIKTEEKLKFEKTIKLVPGGYYLFGCNLTLADTEKTNAICMLKQGKNFVQVSLTANKNSGRISACFQGNSVGGNATLKFIIKSGSLTLSTPFVSLLTPPDKSINLKNSYLKLPFAVSDNGKIIELMKQESGTIEFWVYPLWRETDGRGFADEGMRGFFFRGKNKRQCISIYSWNKFPNIYFDIKNKQGIPKFSESVYLKYNDPLRGWKSKSWHHIALTWEQDKKGKTQINGFVDGSPTGTITQSYDMNIKFKGDFFLGIMKSGRFLSYEKRANAEMALFRVSDKPRYNLEGFIPAIYGFDNKTLCFFPLQAKNQVEGVFRALNGAKKKCIGEIINFNKKK